MKFGIAIGLVAVTLYSQPLVTTVAGAGGLGAANHQLHYPGGIAFDGNDNLYIADSYNHRILKMKPSGEITILLGTGAPGIGANQLNYPRTLALDGAGNIYITDSYNHRIQKLSTNGTVTTIAGGNGMGSELNQLAYPRGIAVDSAGNVFVSDNYNHRVLRVAPGGAITVAAGGRGQGNGANELNYPFGLAVDSAGALYIGDAYNQRVQKILPDGTATTVAGSGGAGLGPNQLVNPVGVDVDKAGNLYVSDTNNNRIQMISPSGVVTTIAGGRGEGKGELELSSPFDTAVDSQGNLFVSDTFNHRIQGMIFPAPASAPQLRHAATNQTGAASPNLLMRVSPEPACVEPLRITAGGIAAAVNGAMFTVPEGVELNRQVRISIQCQNAELITAQLNVTATQPRLFTNWANQPLAETATGEIIGEGAPAVAGSVISVYGTGFGALQFPDGNGLRTVTGTVTATIDGLAAEVIYAGTAPGQGIGVQQINLRVPAEVEAGLKPILVFVDGVPTRGGSVIAVRRPDAAN